MPWDLPTTTTTENSRPQPRRFHLQRRQRRQRLSQLLVAPEVSRLEAGGRVRLCAAT